MEWTKPPPQLLQLRFVQSRFLCVCVNMNAFEMIGDYLFVWLKVRKSDLSDSVVALQSAVEDTVAQLEDQGLLSGEALGQIFTSVSYMLNTEADQDQKDERTKVTQSTKLLKWLKSGWYYVGAP